MKLSTKQLQPFVGGQVEIQNQVEEYLYRGEIADINIEGGGEDASLVVKLKWLAKNDGKDAFSGQWSLDARTDYRCSLLIYSASDIGEGRIALSSSITGELAVFFPKGGSRLDPSKVKGLVPERVAV